ncbi:MAG: DUF429 domain-containing protein [Solirubrobacterales bacterium]
MSSSGDGGEARVLGLDLAGVTGSTGYAVLEGAQNPTLTKAGVLPLAKTPVAAEDDLLQLIDDVAPTRIAIDAPLTLPPCLTCPPYCRGPGAGCELEASRSMWEVGSNPVIRRQCELKLKELIPGSDPKPTMGLGVITARAVALMRKLETRGIPPASASRGEVLEVYPAATLLRLGHHDRPPREAPADTKAVFYESVIGALPSVVSAELSAICTGSDDAFDAFLSAYTAWLYPGGLEHPPADFNVASGWIWFPRPAEPASVLSA